MMKKHTRYRLMSFLIAFAASIVLASPTLDRIAGARGGSAGQFTFPQNHAPDRKGETTTVAGKWTFIFDTGTGDEREEAATFEQDGTTVTGKLLNTDVHGTIKDNQLELSFPFTAGEGRMSGTLNIKGKLENDALKGTWDFGKMSGTFTATRVK
jgi:hypothetical protein